ncbi:hypothetical protein CROQUDRAFT_661074 [Cronartium quercuum f. sp. fusiforme G11]|uniref:CSD domain-containing protein n=1 Tax=Cronartium quercuum f. sp. fusiforme G11 TaxID=708437 RepID=A0A9P6NBG6_9BASI|nr:hypothetical protein CROQUDRAFT_661074 [Cronartium quercuum f. sp. fusiforme G11]
MTEQKRNTFILNPDSNSIQQPIFNHSPSFILNYPNQPLPPPIITHRRSGTCKFFNVGKGFGFIQDSRPDELPIIEGDPGKDIFVHFSCIVSCQSAYKSLLDGESVEYILGRSNKGLAALDITGPNRLPVKGSNLKTNRSQTILHPPQFHSIPFHFPYIQPTPPPMISYNPIPISTYSPNLIFTSNNHHNLSSPNLGVTGTRSPKTNKETNISPTFDLAVGGTKTSNSMRRELTDHGKTLNPLMNHNHKMTRINSAPGSRIGIGIAWENHHQTIWSPPGGGHRKVSLKSDGRSDESPNWRSPIGNEIMTTMPKILD